LYLDCKVVTNLTKLLEGLVQVCVPTHLDDVSEMNLLVYSSTLAALTRIAEQAQARTTRPQAKAVALKILDQLQPEAREEAPGSLRTWTRSRVSVLGSHTVEV
jgi:hypothetical protein